jgi:hypothetical protein
MGKLDEVTAISNWCEESINQDDDRSQRRAMRNKCKSFAGRGRTPKRKEAKSRPRRKAKLAQKHGKSALKKLEGRVDGNSFQIAQWNKHNTKLKDNVRALDNDAHETERRVSRLEISRKDTLELVEALVSESATARSRLTRLEFRQQEISRARLLESSVKDQTEGLVNLRSSVACLRKDLDKAVQEKNELAQQLSQMQEKMDYEERKQEKRASKFRPAWARHPPNPPRCVHTGPSPWADSEDELDEHTEGEASSSHNDSRAIKQERH